MSFFLVTRLLNSRICLFHTDSKRSLRPLPFLSRTGNVLHASHLQSFRILVFYKETFRFTPAICKDCTVPSHRLAVSKPIGLCRLKNGIAILADSKLRLARFSAYLSFPHRQQKSCDSFFCHSFFQRLITFCS